MWLTHRLSLSKELVEWGVDVQSPTHGDLSYHGQGESPFENSNAVVRSRAEPGRTAGRAGSAPWRLPICLVVFWLAGRSTDGAVMGRL